MIRERTTLGAICAAGGGAIQTGPFGSQLHASDYSLSGTPVVMPQDIGDNALSEENAARVGQDHVDRLSRHRMVPGDIVYSRRGDVERRALIRADNDGWLCGTGCLRVSFGATPVADPRFVSYYLGLGDTRRWIVRHAVGATMLNLNTSILANVPVDLPTLSEQRGIAEVLEVLDDRIAANAKLATSAERLMTALASTASGTAPVGDIALHSTQSRRPDEFDAVVAHFSLPAFDDGALPEAAQGQAIKSNKFLVDRPCVLMSKLNPRIPRIWNVPVSPEQMALASTEFVVLEPLTVGVSALWAVLSQPAVSTALTERVAGTSGSHQRVKPAEVLALEVPDPRTLAIAEAESIAALGLIVHARRVESDLLASTRDALLPLLMSGKIRVRDMARVVEGVV